MLPIRTTLEDVKDVTAYLLKKPTGATVKEAKSVLDGKRLDGRKLTALKAWGLIEDQEKLKLTERGRQAAKNDHRDLSSSLIEALREKEPYRAIIERAAHRSEASLTATEVAAHWHDHFSADVSDNDKTLNDQAVCFFQIAEGADLGSLVIGRRGAPTRFDFSLEVVRAFADGSEMPKSDDEDEINEELSDDESATEKERLHTADTTGAATSSLGKSIFIGHGKNKIPLDQLKKILDQFQIPYKVAIDEPNLGRPISAKVKATMADCNCAILIFTADEEFATPDGDTIWRPSENVVHELGATSYLYGSRIVILKEQSVKLPSNFSDLGYISFNKDELQAQSMDLLRELIGFGIVKVST